MDVVKSFNTELSSLYDVKPPISKAKMTSITKGAIKGIKFYKHIVQSVEKFIQKCRPEYKVPGLYVVDSIVRQSRHQFGADKDVFGPRFLKNINLTFQQLFKCAEDDRPKIIRVLNLWQKNAVFPIDVIQPLMDMGNPNTSSEWPLDAPAESVKESPAKPAANEESRTPSRRKEIDPALWKGWQAQGNDETAAADNRPYAEMSTKNLEKFTKAEMTIAIENEVSSSSMFRTQIKQENLPEENTVKFNKKLLDFDYGDEEDEEEVKNDDSHLSNQPNALALSMAQNLLSNPELLRQLQQMQHTIQQNEQAFNSELGFNQQASIKQEEGTYSQDARSSPPAQQPPLPPAYHQPPTSDNDKDDRVLPQPPLPPQDLDERSLSAIMTPHIPLPQASLTASLPPNQTDKDDRVVPEPRVVPARDLDERSLAAILAPLSRGVLPPLPYTEASGMLPYQNFPQQPPLPMMDPVYQQQPVLPSSGGGHDEDERLMYSMPGEPPLPPQDFDERQQLPPAEDSRSSSRKERSRSRSGSRTRGRSGRHRSHSRSPRRKRSRSRSPSRKSSSSSSARSKERERLREKERERDKERERKRKGLPPIRKNCVSVCTTTLWIGHVPKSCTEMEISSAFGTFGTILSIYMIPPRGCAYVVMDRRQDAYKALTKLKNAKILQSNSVKMAWAPGKGVKGKEYKDYWEVDAGVSYVPYDKIPEDAATLDLLEEGGFIDEESLPDNLKVLRQQPDDKALANKVVDPQATAPFNSGGPPMVPPPILPSTTVNLPPMLLHHPMQQQFGLHLSGLLPPQAMMMQLPMGIPPPNQMLMVQQQSQNMMGNQALPLVGGVPPLVPRSIANALQNIKNAQITDPAVGSPRVPAPSATGDATPTDEDGTSVSSPIPPPKPIGANPVTTASNQFNHMMNLHNSNRPMLPVTTSGTPIPYPPPVGYNFPPPGMRQQGMPPNAQFPWMEGDSSQRGMPPFNRPPPTNQSPMKDTTDRRPVDMDRSASPDKMSQEMVISTDDESSMDRDYQHNDVPPAGGRFPGTTEFPRMPMGMHRMRPPMQGGPRFPQNMPPFHPRMGGPRPMGMHPGHRMEDFGPRGPRMPVAPPPGPHRGERNEGRDWYPRDFEGPPPFERDRPPFRDDRNSGGWTTAESLGNNSRQNQDGDRREDRNRDFDKRDRQGPNAYVPRDRPRVDDGEEFNIRQRPRPPPKVKTEAELKNDLFRLKNYQRDKKPEPHTPFQKQMVKRKAEDDKPAKNDFQVVPKNKVASEKDIQDAAEIARREREARKRSRWGRTLSEEREFQEQRKCEIEMKRTEIERKFQKIEQSAQADQPNPSSAESTGEVPGSEKEITNVDDTTKTVPSPSINPAETVSEFENPVVELIAQKNDSPPVPDLPVAGNSTNANVESEFTMEPSASATVVEPIFEAINVNSFAPPTVAADVLEALPLAESVSKPEVPAVVLEPPVTNSAPQTNDNHVDCDVPSTTFCAGETSKPFSGEAVSNEHINSETGPLQETSKEEVTNAMEVCSASESLLSTES